ncbi:MAG: SIMPL domain-containing protein [Firmicutes bacterium]|nr:SIMPL domain-containing protein [Bacillota bacterium]
MTAKFGGKLVLTSLVVLLVLGAALGSLYSDGTAAAQESTKEGTLRVNGQAVVTGQPDIAYVSLGVETRGESAQKAAADNAALMSQVMAALKELGLTDKELSTSGYNVYSYQQTNRSDSASETTTVYVVQNRLNITVRNLETVGEIIDTAIEAGANQIQGVSFDIEDKQAMQMQALANAVKQAQAKAEAMAEAAGVKLGGIKVITEQYTNYIPYTDTAAVRTFALAEAKTQITPGDVEVTADVAVEFWF